MIATRKECSPELVDFYDSFHAARENSLAFTTAGDFPLVSYGGMLIPLPVKGFKTLKVVDGEMRIFTG